MKIGPILPAILLVLSHVTAPARSAGHRAAREPTARPAKKGMKAAETVLPPAASAGYHLVFALKQRIQGTLTDIWHTPGLTPQEWLVSIPELPQLDGQRDARTMLFVGGSDQAVRGWEMSPRHRPVLSARVGRSPSNYLPVQAVFQATLYARQLMPGPSTTPVPDLSDEERDLNLLPTPTLDWGAPTFQRWLGRNDLRRRGGESDLTFARRAFDVIRRSYTYYFNPHQNRQVSYLCDIDDTDCGGLSFLLVATLRAGGVPAHALIGRNAWAGLKASDKIKTSGADTNGATHVKSEFFARGIGWVPVEMSGAVSDKAAPAEAFFGRDGGNFLTFHQDPDLVYNTVYFGVRTERLLQTPAHWVRGSGTVSGSTDDVEWQVTPAP